MKEHENHWGPQYPHPLSKIRTELVWEGKYDEYGNRREVEITGSDMPLQKVEAIDEPRSSAEGAGEMDLFKKKSRRQDDFRNMLIWGDNKLVMAGLLKEFKGKIDLIYIDPPFDVGADFTMNVPIGDSKEALNKDQSIMEAAAYKDMWGKGTDSYIHMMYERFTIMKELLSEKGSIYVHCDWRVNSYIRLVLDDIFGKDNFQNEGVIHYTAVGLKAKSKKFHQNTETIFYFAKNKGKHIWNEVYEPIKDTSKYRTASKHVWNPDTGKAERQRDENGNIEYFEVSEYKPDNFIELPALRGDKKVGYPTQKHEDLLERIIRTSSSEGSLVADIFCGSGTTGVVAEKNGRRWIMCDLGRFAIHTTRKRMIEIQRQLYNEQKPYRAFDVYNLGRYERQWWQKERLAGADEEHRDIVLAFYRAEKLETATSPVLHGRKGGAFVHVDSIDSILTFTDLKPIVEATQAAGGKELHCLAWEFEMELKRNTEALEHEYGVKVRLIRIPREVMEKNRRPGVDSVPFFEMATLSANPIINIEGGERIADVELTNFLPSLSEVSSKELEVLKERTVKSGFDFIDFWAIDFDHQGEQPFKHHWQDYRLRKDRSLKIKSDCKHKYTDTKPHRICVKVIDVFGCDTSMLLEVPGSGSSPRRDKG